MAKQLTADQIEGLLTMKFKGKNCSWSYPGYKTVYGMVDEIALDTVSGAPEVIVQMNDKRYSCSLESISDCLKRLKK